MKKICLIDGYGFIFRAFYAIPNSLKSAEGVPVNAVFGFTKSLMALQEATNVEYMVVIFDYGGKTFRNDLYPAYKANRKPAPDDLIPQFALVKEATKALNIKSIALQGYEADDLIATYTQLALQNNLAVEIISSDKDLMQLVDDKNSIYMFDSLKKQKITEKEVFDKFGVIPAQVVEVQALLGDSSDNIPGIKGVGIKGATELLQQFGSLENIFNNVDKIKKAVLQNKVRQGKEMAYLSLSLATLKKNVPISVPISEFYKQQPHAKTLYKFLRSLSFYSLATQIATKYAISKDDLDSYNAELIKLDKATPTHTLQIIKIKHQLKINNKQLLNDAMQNLAKNYIISIHYIIEKKHIIQLSLYDSLLNSNYNITITPDESSVDLFNKDKAPTLSLQDVVIAISPILENPAILKVFFNLKSLLHLISAKFTSCEDIMLMDYLIYGPSKNTLSIILKKTYPSIEFETITADNLMNLFNFYQPKLISTKAKYLYEYFDKPLLFVLYYMEKQGVVLNTQTLKKLSLEFQNTLSILEDKIFALSMPFNISSPKQTGEVLFDKLKLAGGKKNRSGTWKTDASTLEKLVINNIPIASLILKWRQISKLKNTYSDKLPEKINPKTDTLHTTFLQTSTNTGRLSSIEPNLQNIPIKSAEGKKIRQAFIAKADYKIISLDYSQIELRLLAVMGNVTKLIKAFHHQEDIHIKTASEIFNIPLNEVTDDLRRQAKTINFGIIYGQTQYGLANQLNISNEEAKKYILAYFKQYAEIQAYMDNAIVEARTFGYVTTLFNRKCFINDINHSNKQLQLFAERAAINAKLQGTASDIIKRAMINMFNYINSHNYDAKLLLQIHDEIIVEVHETQVAKLALQLKKIMEKAVILKIPLDVECNVADNWLEAK